MTELWLGIALTFTGGAVGVWLVNFHLVETIAVYAASFIISIPLFLWTFFIHWLRKERLKAK